MSLRHDAARLVSTILPRNRTPGAKLALHGGAPVRDPRIPWPSWPIHGLRERIALLRCLEGGAWWYGERVARFEDEFAAFQGGRFCVTASTGTSALEIAMQVIGLQRDDEVVVPAFTFVATATAVKRMGGRPIFADVEPDSWCLDPEAVRRAFSPRTKAIIPVHFGGRVADMDRIDELARERGVQVIEDACHSWGSRWKGRGTGTLGSAGAFSFQMHKNLTAGEGGAIVTNDPDFARQARSFVNCGRVKDAHWYYHENVGTNARITEYQAALLSAQLSRLEKQTATREKNAAILARGLGEITGLSIQQNDPRITRRGYHLFCFRIDEEAFGCSRKDLIRACQAEGLPISDMYYPEPLYRQPVFANDRFYRGVSCPVAEDLAWRSAAWLNHWLLLGTEPDMQDIIAIFQKVKTHASKLGG